MVDLWLLLPGHANFSVTAAHWEKLIEIGRVWPNLEYKNPNYPATFVRKHDTDETSDCDRGPSTSEAARAKEEEPDSDPFTGK